MSKIKTHPSFNEKALTIEQLAVIMQSSMSTVLGWVMSDCPCYSVNDRPVKAPHSRVRFVLDDVILWRKGTTRL